MRNPAELALVIKALECGVGGCVHWHPKSEAQVRHARSRFGLTPEGIKGETIQFVQAGGRVDQRKETRPNWQHKREYWYKGRRADAGDFCQRAVCRNRVV